MAAQYLLPGYGDVDETAEAEFLLPGYGDINETQAAAGGTIIANPINGAFSPIKGYFS